MDIELSKRELIDFYGAMKEIDDKENNKKRMTYALMINEDRLESEVKALLECAKPSSEYKLYDSKSMQIIRDYAEKDDDGNPIVNDENGTVLIKRDVFEEWKNKTLELDKEYSEVIDKRKKEVEEYNSMLDEEIIIDTIQISMDDFPDYISKTMMRYLKPLIKQDE
tara:strand:+ start:19506 stop:20003 length:498 start_codon:yes stop_codon:yes gene_type:complete